MCCLTSFGHFKIYFSVQFESVVEKLQTKKKKAVDVHVKHTGRGTKGCVTYLNDLNKWTSAGLDKVVLHCIRTLRKLKLY